MRKITDDLWKVDDELGLYAERKAGLWFLSDESETQLDGPFDTLEALEASRSGEPELQPAPEPGGPLESYDSTDLVTLREAAEFLPITRQALQYHRRRGSLKVEPLVTARSIELYSLAALKEAYGR
jgi:hypothetical protein